MQDIAFEIHDVYVETCERGFDTLLTFGRCNNYLLAACDVSSNPLQKLSHAAPFDVAAEGVDVVGQQARPMPMEHALSNGFGFGGVNASIIFRNMA